MRLDRSDTHVQFASDFRVCKASSDGERDLVLAEIGQAAALPPSETDHRRVPAVFTYLQGQEPEER